MRRKSYKELEKENKLLQENNKSLKQFLEEMHFENSVLQMDVIDYYMEYTSEIIEAIIEYYSNDLNLTASCLIDLLYGTEHGYVKAMVTRWLEDNHYCLDCGNKLQLFCYNEAHTELDNNDNEEICTYICPKCDR